MQTTLMGWIHQLGTLEYWEALLAGFEGLGPLVPILLAMVESFFPPLPLIAIVALNVAAHGGLLGFLYSWAGVALGGIIMFLFWRRLIKRFFWKVASRSPKLEKAQQWVNRFDTSSLFMLSLLPFTPTSFISLSILSLSTPTTVTFPLKPESSTRFLIQPPHDKTSPNAGFCISE